jgi:hypothetical protein
MAKALSDPSTQWSFSCQTDSGGTKPPAGGLVLQQVQHDGHNFARDIRVVGFWVEIETVSPTGSVTSTTKKFYVLDDASFTVAPIAILAPLPVSTPPSASTFAYLKELDVALDFKEYFTSAGNYFAYAVKARFDAPAFFAAFTNCELAGLTVEQVFLFSRYGNAVAHEPSGNLNAARCHPILRYDTTPNTAVNRSLAYGRLKSIRFDYRLHLYIDRHHDAMTNSGLKQIGNQAGLFADEDVGTAKVVGYGAGNIWRGLSTAVSRAIFEAVEKPLVLEVTLSGLENGLPLFKTTPGGPEQRCWDNVHWWGSRGARKPMISAPGGFHAAHPHWRWGAAAAAAAPGKKQFGAGWPSGLAANPITAGKWGPLVDPNIWMQTLRVAIVKNDPKLDPTAGVPASNLSKPEWKTLFDTGSRPPDDVSAGDDLVMWYSVEVPRELFVPGSGKSPATTFKAKTPASIFFSGIFFAHEAEVTGLKVGTTDPLYFPTDEPTIRKSKKWYRLAK